MTVFRHPAGKTFRYDFWWRNQRYTGNTHQTTRADALIVESDFKKKLRLQIGGIAPAEATASPAIQDWAEIYYDHVLTREQSRIKRPDRIEDLLRVVLRFFGKRPGAHEKGKFAAIDGEPYHDLRLSAPIEDPMWILKFEDWMNAKTVATGKKRRPLGGQTKNQYRSVMSQMYRLAMQPAYRKRTGVTMNPFMGIPRERSQERTSTVTVEELRRWLEHSSYHIRLALAIAALAPKLRLKNILELKWGVNLDKGFTHITVQDHKTAGSTGRPLVVPITGPLMTILQDARRRRPHAKYVVTYRAKPLKSIRSGVQAAARAAGLKWGRFNEDGVTFHTIRHTMATMLAELSDTDGQPALSESQRKQAMGHKRLETTQRYTHIRPTVERRVLDRLSSITPIVDIVTQPRTRAARTRESHREFVYFVRGGDAIKIGRTRQVAARLGELQVGHADRLVLLATVPGGRGVESALHRRFAHLHRGGEWFLAAPDLVDYLEGITKRARGKSTGERDQIAAKSLELLTSLARH